ncbi:heme exporter protein CcmD [Bartonella sp. HY329]|uniref:heme exporter protein CcmD n=1 Tax=unclassified Bartonella TaxID=2645622 RepID=UPI0021C67A9A|nr:MULTISPECIES: heme exporter protein CcmD [unclassified Bartonella]UXM95107.1 heme exporter protein CcmD [Bartonella sp. HY329]UXN09430.1 heme exporter protein CcmD [Bartonella sp. HY328]
MNHLAFILAAYGAAALGIIALTISIIWRGHILSRKIARLEAIDFKQKRDQQRVPASPQSNKL